MIRLLVADDRIHVRRALLAILSFETDMVVDGEASDGVTAVSEALAIKPDVALIDVEMPGMDGITATREIRRLVPECQVVVFSLYDSEANRLAARQAGAHSFIPKAAPFPNLLQAIRSAARRVA